MIASELSFQIRRTMGIEPTVEQAVAIDTFAQYAADTDDHAVMVLTGAAGQRAHHGETAAAGDAPRPHRPGG